MLIRLGQTVNFQSGDVTAQGTVLAVHDSCGLFVEADRLVPIVLGKGSRFEKVVLGRKLWLSVPGHVVYDRDGAAVGFEQN